MSDDSEDDTGVDESEEMFYAVILERDSPRRAGEIGRIVAKLLEMPVPDAVARVRYGGGLVAEALRESEAQALAASLNDIDIRTRPVLAEEWLTTPRGYKISSLSFADRTVEARLSTGRSFVIPQSDLFGLHLYGLCPDDVASTKGSERSTSLELSGISSLSNMTARGRRLLAQLEEQELTGMEFHLTLYGPPEVGPLRIRRVDFNFACLEEEKLDHSLDNFILLLEKLAERFPDAWNVATVEQFLDDMDPARILYFKAEEAEKFDRWMLQWVRIEARERDARSGEAGEAEA